MDRAGAIVDSRIDAKGDVLVNSQKITNIFANPEHEGILTNIFELEGYLKDHEAAQRHAINSLNACAPFMEVLPVVQKYAQQANHTHI